MWSQARYLVRKDASMELKINNTITLACMHPHTMCLINELPELLSPLLNKLRIQDKKERKSVSVLGCKEQTHIPQQRVGQRGFLGPPQPVVQYVGRA